MSFGGYAPTTVGVVALLHLYSVSGLAGRRLRRSTSQRRSTHCLCRDVYCSLASSGFSLGSACHGEARLYTASTMGTPLHRCEFVF